MNNTENALRHKSLKLLTEGFKQEFATKIYEDERFTELLMEIAVDFVQENIPVVDEVDSYELGYMLMETVNLTTR